MLADHIARFFGDVGVDTTAVVGFAGAVTSANRTRPDVILCDYDLLASVPSNPWQHDDTLRRLPIVAVSLSRRPDEMHLLDINEIVGFLYLPTLQLDAAARVVYAAARWDMTGRPIDLVRDDPLTSLPPDTAT
jgi:hypothetical protein